MLRLLAAALVLPAAALAAVPAPVVGVASFDQLAQPLPLHYDTNSTNDDARVARASARAKAAGTLLLIDLGGNWLSDARHMTPQALADWLAQWPWR